MKCVYCGVEVSERDAIYTEDYNVYDANFDYLRTEPVHGCPDCVAEIDVEMEEQFEEQVNCAEDIDMAYVDGGDW